MDCYAISVRNDWKHYACKMETVKRNLCQSYGRKLTLTLVWISTSDEALRSYKALKSPTKCKSNITLTSQKSSYSFSGIHTVISKRHTRTIYTQLTNVSIISKYHCFVQWARVRSSVEVSSIFCTF